MRSTIPEKAGEQSRSTGIQKSGKDNVKKPPQTAHHPQVAFAATAINSLLEFAQ